MVSSRVLVFEMEPRQSKVDSDLSPHPGMDQDSEIKAENALLCDPQQHACDCLEERGLMAADVEQKRIWCHHGMDRGSHGFWV